MGSELKQDGKDLRAEERETGRRLAKNGSEAPLGPIPTVFVMLLDSFPHQEMESISPILKFGQAWGLCQQNVAEVILHQFWTSAQETLNTCSLFLGALLAYTKASAA